MPLSQGVERSKQCDGASGEVAEGGQVLRKKGRSRGQDIVWVLVPPRLGSFSRSCPELRNRLDLTF